MITVMDCKEIAEKIGMSPNTIRTLLCRQEFNKYVTYQKFHKVRGRICFKVDYSFLKNLKNYFEMKASYEKSRKVKRWMDEYCRIL